MGMRPSPHLPTSHVVQQRDSSGRNDHSQASSANLSYSNPQTPNEHPGHQPFQGLSRLNEPYRPRDSREAHDSFDPRHSDRDTSRELSQRTDFLREQLSNPALRANGPPLHEDLRFQPQQDRGGYLSQRSQTPLSRSEHGQPPHSSLGAGSHPLFGQRPPPEEPPIRFMRDPHRSMTERLREEQAQAQAQHHAVINREEHMRRDAEVRDLREREMRERDAREAHYRESMMRGRDMRGPPMPPCSGPGPQPDQRAPPTGPMDWVSGVRHPQDGRGWQR
jgi:serine/arginine repetitive matrix protein 2